jgi:hypothetical protein
LADCNITFVEQVELMQSIEEFMQQYFDDRIVDEKREQASRVPFRRKFHTEDCRWDSRAGVLETMQSEKVLSMSSSETGAEVITSRETCSLTQRLRYHLQPVGNGWLIGSVDFSCPLCGAERGKDSCIVLPRKWLVRWQGSAIAQVEVGHTCRSIASALPDRAACRAATARTIAGNYCRCCESVFNRRELRNRHVFVSRPREEVLLRSTDTTGGQ